MPEQSDFRIGQGVWRQAEANGVIEHINWREKEAYVRWYNTNKTDVISLNDLEGNWDWKLKQWILTL